MIPLVLAALFLPLSHFGISSTPLRALLVRRMGEKRYSSAYSLLTVAAFAALILAYRGAPTHPLWSAPVWLRLASELAVLLAILLLVAGLSTPNPTIVGRAALFERADIVRGILRVTRNPFLWGAGLFALAHVVMIGEAAAALCFGSVAIQGLAGAPILDAKKARNHPRDWAAFAAETSDVPFLAIAQGRQHLAWREIGAWRIMLGLGLFVAVLLLHPLMFGGNPLASLI
jgi:uncharacterized membrane protein